MLDADKGQAATLDGEGLRIGIVRARFNDALTGALAEACTAELAALGVAASDVRQVLVPGALEIPVALKAMAESEDYDALIALGYTMVYGVLGLINFAHSEVFMVSAYVGFFIAI